MPFAKVETQVDFPARERETLRFWDERGIFGKLRQKNRQNAKREARVLETFGFHHV